ncbi:molybdopterin guanine dinucleotide-containing S/N-oxide reductase [Bosea rubneri]|uniref:Molybdopterin guanine dinucleotide-containing S/N-oxide reductase n=1 Tax=Bosea rubneri TaxID=3075434 RepID=A0ABU3S355_9HYPH|nr:molybdopterin guanine dinucleotide-containing S/N-oxide reductase [Bosea sp. ZW T0_25]MDU0339214.1 molybdopterin guanine dinucleotide-containing S/N-oxide reductase [Bosea sp. ZW T0_25]
MLITPDEPTVATHWGVYRARMKDGAAVALEPYEHDPDPSPLGLSMIGALDDGCRIRRPAVRASFLEKGAAAGGSGRGGEPFVEIDWPQALDLVAREIARVRESHGNGAIFGGSYGWSSAGRFHHAQSQVHRFLNAVGGYVRSISNYSFAAADAILPHVLGDKRGLDAGHTTWDQLAGHAELIVMFGGTPHKNAQVGSGGISRHLLREGMTACRDRGASFVCISPIRDDAMAELDARWIAPRPNTDVALMLALAHTLIEEGLHDREFLARCTTGFDRFAGYVTGAVDGVPKTPDWAQAISGVPAETIRTLAREMARRRTMIMMSWSLQRAEHGEQPYWMAIALAAMIGQIGLPGGGFGFGYASANGVGNPVYPFSWPTLPQGSNAISDSIPVARIADALLHPGAPYDFNGEKRRYPDIRLIYWAGGNPFHHHQDINRLIAAWRRPETVIVHESWWNATARHADIVLPASTAMERNDIASSSRDRMIAACHPISEPIGESRSDYEIFADLAGLLGARETFTEGRDEEGWIRHFYTVARQRVAEYGMELPDFESFWKTGIVTLPEPQEQTPLLAEFAADPQAHPLKTPSGRIELFSERIAGFGYDDCPGHPIWLVPREWLGAPLAERFPLHLISNQPASKLHSQYDNGALSRSTKIDGREPLRIHPEDARARGLGDGDIVRVFNERGACLAGIVVSDAVMPGVVQMATGAWYDPLEPGRVGSLDKHGNPNVLTQDRGSSRLGQATIAHSCLVEIVRHEGELPPITCYEPPPLI